MREHACTAPRSNQSHIPSTRVSSEYDTGPGLITDVAKAQMRAAWAEELRRRRDADLAHVLRFVRSPQVQGAVVSYLASLRGAGATTP